MKKIGFGGFAGLILLGLGFGWMSLSVGKYFLEKPIEENPAEICKYEIDAMIMAAMGEDADKEEVTEEIVKKMEVIKQKFETPETTNRCISEVTKFEKERIVKIKDGLKTNNMLNAGAGLMLMFAGLMIFLAFKEDQK